MLLLLFFSLLLGSPGSGLAAAQSEAGFLAGGSSMERLLDLVDLKRWGDIIPLAEQLIQKDPNKPAPRYWLGAARLQLEDSVGAIQSLRSAEKLGLDTASLHKVLGLAYYDLHQFLLFEQQMERAIELDPGDYEPRYFLGRYYEGIQNDCGRAMEFFDKAVQLEPEDAKTVYQRGNCQEMMAQHEKALGDYQEAIRLVENTQERFSLPYSGMARLLLERDTERAVELAQKAVELEPQSHLNYLILAQGNERLGRVSKAIEALEKAARLKPTNSSIHYRLYRLYRSLRDGQAAQRALEMFQKLNAVYASQ